MTKEEHMSIWDYITSRPRLWNHLVQWDPVLTVQEATPPEPEKEEHMSIWNYITQGSTTPADMPPEPETDGYENQHATLAQLESARRKSSVTDALESLGWRANQDKGIFELPGKSQDISFESIAGYTPTGFVDLMLRHGLVESVL